MPSLNRIFLIKAHMMVAAFILPVALMFFITGALYTWGIKGGYSSNTYILQLQQPMPQNKEWLSAKVTNELALRSIALPSGQAKVKNAGNSFYFEWTGSGLDVLLEPNTNPLEAKLTIKRTTLHRFFVQLHKAKGGVAFKVYAAILSVCLLFLFISGVLMAWQMVKYRPLLLSAACSGLLVFIILVSIS
ncbi:MAG: PepSY domain-containing protein [Methyloprofundus sp.]|nr:PepSY domain-containing protein [Methyloprofundus sp.]MDT8425870.1 PepSY domain-containing protein [Methyloprofundus sp.]